MQCGLCTVQGVCAGWLFLDWECSALCAVEGQPCLPAFLVCMDSCLTRLHRKLCAASHRPRAPLFPFRVSYCRCLIRDLPVSRPCRWPLSAASELTYLVLGAWLAPRVGVHVHACGWVHVYWCDSGGRDWFYSCSWPKSCSHGCSGLHT